MQHLNYKSLDKQRNYFRNNFIKINKIMIDGGKKYQFNFILQLLNKVYK